jgi:hypothetical protein
MKNLPINLNTFGFVQREKLGNVTIKYKCGRDFVYYALNYYFPSEFNQNVNNPKQIDRENIFGLSVPTAFSWSMLQFVKMPRLLNKYLLILRINKRKVDSFWNFIVAMIFSRISHDKAINLIENSIDRGNVVGVDIALRFQGLEDHIMFVYGYDEDNLYVFDTNKIPVLEYEKITDDEKFIMKLPRRVIKERWKKFSRVWEISKQN